MTTLSHTRILALHVALESMQDQQKRYAFNRHAAELGLEFGIRAMKKYMKLTAAIATLQEMITELEDIPDALQD
jgi:hypothetical protein